MSSYLRPTAASFRLDLNIKKTVTRMAMKAIRIEPRSISLSLQEARCGMYQGFQDAFVHLNLCLLIDSRHIPATVRKVLPVVVAME